MLLISANDRVTKTMLLISAIDRVTETMLLMSANKLIPKLCY